MKYFEIYQKDTDNKILSGAAKSPSVLIDLEVTHLKGVLEKYEETAAERLKAYEERVEKDKSFWTKDKSATDNKRWYWKLAQGRVDECLLKILILENESVAFMDTDKKHTRLVPVKKKSIK